MKLIVEDIKKSFDKKEVLKGCTYEFEAGKIYGLLGRNGAGKTTFFKTVYGDYGKMDGACYIEKDGERKPLKIENVDMVFSQPVLPDFLTGYEFLKFFTEVKCKGENIDTMEYFRMLSFKEEDAHRLIRGYSHGMKSKLNLITVFISKPEVIFLDEPLTSIDLVAAAEIKEWLLKLKENHVIIFSTHIMQLAKDICDEVVLLKDGVFEGLSNMDKNSPEYEAEILRHLKEGGAGTNSYEQEHQAINENGELNQRKDYFPSSIESASSERGDDKC